MKEHAHILLVDDDDSSREALSLLLKATGYQVTPAPSGAAAIKHLELTPFDLVITDLFLPDMNGLDILRTVKEHAPEMEVVVITGNASADTAVRAMKQGAYDYITKPLNIDELRIVIAKALEKRQLLSENVYLKKQLRDRYEFSNIIGTSEAMQSVFNLMKRIVKTDSTVLVMGESGTGKEIVAKAIHFNSHRKDKPFIAVHCGAIPETLLESELFGHTKGSFTGAHKDKIGKFEAAHGGTIFLDEIGTMPLQLQSKLLRVLQEQEVERVGSTKPVKIDIRVISATNQHLADEVKRGQFREDLYYRLNVIPLTMPPLRERTADILPLVRHFMEKYCREMNRTLLTLTRDALEAMESYDWPGNVRELENVVERTVALTDGEQISRADLPSNISRVVPAAGPALPHVTSAGIDLMKTVEELERQMIEEALTLADGVKARAAALLHLNRTTLVEKMRRLGMPLLVLICTLLLTSGLSLAASAYDACRKEEARLREIEADRCSGFTKLVNPSGCIGTQKALIDYDNGKCWKLGGVEKPKQRVQPTPVFTAPLPAPLPAPSAAEPAPAASPPTLADLQVEIDRLKTENARLKAENERLRDTR